MAAVQLPMIISAKFFLSTNSAIQKDLPQFSSGQAESINLAQSLICLPVQ